MLVHLLLATTAGTALAARCSVSQQRPCPYGRESSILVMGQGEAGIGDRMYLFSRLGLWADALCANLVVGSPRLMLSKSHNYGLEVPERRKWGDYWNATNGDGGPLLVTNDTLLTALGSTIPKKRRTLEEQRSDAELLSKPRRELAEFFDRNAYSLLDSTVGGIEEQYFLARASMRPFVWRLDEAFYPNLGKQKILAVWELVEKELEGCRQPEIHIAGGDTPISVPIVKNFLAQVREPSSALITIHLRRVADQNSVVDCDTDVDAVVRGVTCALREQYCRSSGSLPSFCTSGEAHNSTTTTERATTSKRTMVRRRRSLLLRGSGSSSSSTPRQFKLVLFTDDSDPVYIAEVHSALADALPGSSFFHGDPLVAEILAQTGFDSDNYLVYTTERPIRRKADLDITFEHKSSNTCASATTCALQKRRPSDNGGSDVSVGVAR
mmetsp:Transcript_5543/g.17465  ORF Transcript_5543/g.17465 Transcript_5543/m.17465 type:complete len:439 (-) Transcript_5543:1200-2516(-)